MSTVFISYRRKDSGPEARLVLEALERTFGAGAAFMDVDSIRASERWESRIESTLDKASIVVVVIGPSWLSVADEFSRRRIDHPDDWVRNEIIRALNGNKKILPVLVRGATFPNRDGLPEALRSLAQFQALTLREDAWQRDVGFLTSEIVKLAGPGLKPLRTELRYPSPLDETPGLAREELEKLLRETFPEWTITEKPAVKEKAIDGKIVEIKRTYRFRSFQDAMHFMATASRYIDDLEHHPDWRNLWRQVVVWLTTWDTGFRPSHKDILLAKYLDNLFKEYQAPRTLPASVKAELPADE